MVKCSRQALVAKVILLFPEVGGEMSGMKKILLVCTGNTCRSPIAEGLFKKSIKEYGLNIEVVSAGLSALEGALASPPAITVMRDRYIDISKHRARQLTATLVGKADLVLTMTADHKERLLRMAPEAKGKVFTLKEFAWKGQRGLDIEDPFGKSAEAYQESAQEIDDALKEIVARLREESGSGERKK